MPAAALRAVATENFYVIVIGRGDNQVACNRIML